MIINNYIKKIIDISRKQLYWWFTWSIIKEPNVTPLYIVPQNIPTPKQHIIVAIRVAYGTLAIQSLHILPINNKKKFINN